MVPFDKPHTRFPINVPLRLCLYLAPFSRYYHLFPKTYKGHVILTYPFWGLSIMHGPLLLCINQQMTLKVPSLTDSKDTIGGNNLQNGSCDTNYAN